MGAGRVGLWFLGFVSVRAAFKTHSHSSGSGLGPPGGDFLVKLSLLILGAFGVVSLAGSFFSGGKLGGGRGGGGGEGPLPPLEEYFQDVP